LREVILGADSGSIVVFIDEIDVTLGLDFTDDFFAAIRAVHNNRAQHPDYERLTFVLSGVATPDEIITDNRRTPFNIGQSISLNDFTKKQCVPFRSAIEARFAEPGRDFFDQIYGWTGGHPYLTQKLCDAILRASEKDDPNLVNTLVDKLFLAPKDQVDSNLQFVQSRITSDVLAQEMLRTYKRILQGEKPVADDEQTPAINRLRLYGLVVTQNGGLKVRNELYARVFDFKWADELLKNLNLGLPGHYKVLQPIGQGGFSDVYLAQDLRSDEEEQLVAIKILKSPQVSGPELNKWRKRFDQEATTLAKLDHPNIVRILETGPRKTGRGGEAVLYIAMEYIAGGTLGDRLKTDALRKAEILPLIENIGAALNHAHERGMVHSDVNPNNILLDTDQEAVRPVLTDFGIATLFSPYDLRTRIVTDNPMGTPRYMPPEQYKPEELTPVADIYALAVVCFEMFTGPKMVSTTSPLPPLSSVAPQIGRFFDEMFKKATAIDPADRFQSVDDFISAFKEGNREAERAEHIVRQNKATQAVKAALIYMEVEDYDSEIALGMVNEALKYYPDYVDALRWKGKIYFTQKQYPAALEAYRQAYEQIGDPSYEVGREYLEILSQVADIAWQRQNYLEAIEHYETIRQILAEYKGDDSTFQEIWHHTRSRLIEYHNAQGIEIYVAGNDALAAKDSERLDEAIAALENDIKALNGLQTKSESQNLANKLKQLRVKKHQGKIETTEALLDEAQDKYINEDVLKHYLNLDKAYKRLIELEPETELWQENRREKLKQHAVFRKLLAKQAADYETAIRHYKRIIAIEEEDYPGLSAELEIDTATAIEELEEKAEYENNYFEIRNLMSQGEHLEALKQLDEHFISKRNYEYRDVPKLIWELVHAKQTGGEYLFGWDGASRLEAFMERIVAAEQKRVDLLKVTLEPWSNLPEIINDQCKLLTTLEREIKEVEAKHTEANGLGKLPELEMYHRDIDSAKKQLQSWRTQLEQIETTMTSQQIEGWLQTIYDIENKLQGYYRIEEMQEFFEQSDAELEIIEEDPKFATLQALMPASMRIRRTIDQTQIKMQAQLGHIQEDEIFLMRQKLFQFQRWYKVNRIVIPVSLILAIIAGKVFLPQIKDLPTWFSPIAVTATALLIAYLIPKSVTGGD